MLGDLEGRGGGGGGSGSGGGREGPGGRAVGGRRRVRRGVAHGAGGYTDALMVRPHDAPTLPRRCNPNVMCLLRCHAPSRPLTATATAATPGHRRSAPRP